MTDNLSQQDQIGVLIGPLCRERTADQLATSVFELLTTLGLRCSDISRVYINCKAHYARIEVFKTECEDYLVKVLKEVKSIMSLYDLRELLECPERLLAVRIREVDLRLAYQEITDGGTPTYRPTAGDNLPASSHNEQPAAIGSDKYTKTPDNEAATNAVVSSLTKSSPTTSSFQIEFETLEEEGDLKILQHKATSTTDILPFSKALYTDPMSSLTSTEKPVMISAQTSTPVVYPCGCPETVFYKELQHIGTETRYAEFKKGGVIHDQRGFRNLVAKYVCGFLNSEGGTLYLGVNDDGLVLGIPVDKPLEDDLSLEIDFAIRLIKPAVNKCEYSVNFARVMETSGEFSTDLKILEVCVKPHIPPASFYSYNGIFYLRRDGSLHALTQDIAKKGH